MREKKTALVLLVVFIIFFPAQKDAFAQEGAAPSFANAPLSVEQRIMGLMTVWSEAKYNFPWFDKLPDLNLDAAAEAFLPRVVAARDTIEYYRLLMEFAVLLRDGHTAVLLLVVSFPAHGRHAAARGRDH